MGSHSERPTPRPQFPTHPPHLPPRWRAAAGTDASGWPPAGYGPPLPPPGTAGKTCPARGRRRGAALQPGQGNRGGAAARWIVSSARAACRRAQQGRCSSARRHGGCCLASAGAAPPQLPAHTHLARTGSHRPAPPPAAATGTAGAPGRTCCATPPCGPAEQGSRARFVGSGGQWLWSMQVTGPAAARRGDGMGSCKAQPAPAHTALAGGNHCCGRAAAPAAPVAASASRNGAARTCCSAASGVAASTTVRRPSRRSCSRLSGKYQATSAHGLAAISAILLLLWGSGSAAGRTRFSCHVGAWRRSMVAHACADPEPRCAQALHTGCAALRPPSPTPGIRHKRQQLAVTQEAAVDDGAVGGAQPAGPHRGQLHVAAVPAAGVGVQRAAQHLLPGRCRARRRGLHGGRLRRGEGGAGGRALAGGSGASAARRQHVNAGRALNWQTTGINAHQ